MKGALCLSHALQPDVCLDGGWTEATTCFGWLECAESCTASRGDQCSGAIPFLVRLPWGKHRVCISQGLFCANGEALVGLLGSPALSWHRFSIQMHCAHRFGSCSSWGFLEESESTPHLSRRSGGSTCVSATTWCVNCLPFGSQCFLSKKQEFLPSPRELEDSRLKPGGLLSLDLKKRWVLLAPKIAHFFFSIHFRSEKKKNRCCSCDFSKRRAACLTGDQRFRQLGGFFPSLKIMNNCTKISDTLARVPNSAGVLKGYSFYLEDLILKNCPVVLYVHHILNGCFFFSLQEYQVTFGPRCYFTF